MSVLARRRVSTFLLSLLATLVAVVGLSLTSASAAPYGTTTATVGLSTTTPCAGGSMSASGVGFAPGESVALVLNSTPQGIGTVVADANGAFSAPVTVPNGVTGTHTLTATGATTGSVSSGSFTVTATCGGATADAPQAEGRSGPLAYTGLPVFALAGGALLLLVGGGLLLMLGRRRRS